MIQTFTVERTAKDTAILKITREMPTPENSDLGMTYEYSEENKLEKYVFFLTLEQLYQLTQYALRASSETVKIGRGVQEP